MTGASGGIGIALAKSLSESGFRLVMVSRTADESKKLSSMFGSDNKYYDCDLSVVDNVKKLGERIKNEIENIHILIHGAGIGVYKSFEEVSDEDWINSFNINITSPFVLTSRLMEKLSRNEDSLVLNIGSGSGVIPMKNRSVYCATKFAMRGWSLSLSKEFTNRFPGFCVVTLGSILTEFGPLTIEDKKSLMQNGKDYLTPEFVAGKITEIINNPNREEEYEIYPKGYVQSFL